MKLLSKKHKKRFARRNLLPHFSESSGQHKKAKRQYLVNRSTDWRSKKMKPALVYAPVIILLNCPKKFSIIENPKETLEFFRNSFFHHERKDKACIDFSDVEEISIDVLMYFITLLRILTHKKKDFHF